MTSLEINITAGGREFVRWLVEDAAYEDASGATLYSGAAEPSEADATDCIQTPRTPPAAPPAPREISKLTIKRRLEVLGKWDAFKAILAANTSLDDEFWLAQSIRTDDAMFTTHADNLKAALSLTDAQFNALLAP